MIFGGKGNKTGTPLDSIFLRENYLMPDVDDVFLDYDRRNPRNVPIRLFKDNMTCESTVGFETWFVSDFMDGRERHLVKSVIQDFKARSVMFVIKHPYLSNIHFKNIEGWSDRGFGSLWFANSENETNRNVSFENITLNNWWGGLMFTILGDRVDGPPDNPEPDEYRIIPFENVTVTSEHHLFPNPQPIIFQSRNKPDQTSYVDWENNVMYLK